MLLPLVSMRGVTPSLYTRRGKPSPREGVGGDGDVKASVPFPVLVTDIE